MKIGAATRATWMVGVMLAATAVAVAEERGAASDTPRSRLDQLAWLAGSWVSDSGSVRSEEHWMTPRGGLMVGMSRRVSAGRVRSFEFLRIRERGDTIAYLANPGGGAMTPFVLVEMAERRVVFENRAHDFPQRILYWLEADGRLRARVEGRLRGRLEAEDYGWRPGSLTR